MVSASRRRPQRLMTSRFSLAASHAAIGGVNDAAGEDRAGPPHGREQRPAPVSSLEFKHTEIRMRRKTETRDVRRACPDFCNRTGRSATSTGGLIRFRRLANGKANAGLRGERPRVFLRPQADVLSALGAEAIAAVDGPTLGRLERHGGRLSALGADGLEEFTLRPAGTRAAAFASVAAA